MVWKKVAARVGRAGYYKCCASRIYYWHCCRVSCTGCYGGFAVKASGLHSYMSQGILESFLRKRWPEASTDLNSPWFRGRTVQRREEALVLGKVLG